jgi:hypothetical protein
MTQARDVHCIDSLEDFAEFAYAQGWKPTACRCSPSRQAVERMWRTLSARPMKRCYCGLMPAPAITFAHLRTSAGK